MQFFQNWVSGTCRCFSLLDKNMLTSDPLVLHCFQRGGRRSCYTASLLHLKTGEKFWNIGRCGWKSTLENTQSRYLMAY